MGINRISLYFKHLSWQGFMNIPQAMYIWYKELHLNCLWRAGAQERSDNRRQWGGLSVSIVCYTCQLVVCWSLRQRMMNLESYRNVFKSQYMCSQEKANNWISALERERANRQGIRASVSEEVFASFSASIVSDPHFWSCWGDLMKKPVRWDTEGKTRWAMRSWSSACPYPHTEPSYELGEGKRV